MGQNCVKDTKEEEEDGSLFVEFSENNEYILIDLI